MVVNGIALMCRPADASRKSEVDTVRAILRKELNQVRPLHTELLLERVPPNQFPSPQVIVEPKAPNTLLCGSDVLFTGREFFVGLSTWTNTEGAVAVASTWPEYPCTPIKVSYPKTFTEPLLVGPASHLSFSL